MQKNAKIRYVFERRMQTSCGLGATSQLTSSPSHSRLLCRKCMQVHSAFNNAACASIGRPNWPSRPPNSSFQASLLLLPVSCTTNILLAISVTRFVTVVEGVEPSCKLCVARKMFSAAVRSSEGCSGRLHFRSNEKFAWEAAASFLHHVLRHLNSACDQCWIRYSC